MDVIKVVWNKIKIIIIMKEEENELSGWESNGLRQKVDCHSLRNAHCRRYDGLREFIGRGVRYNLE